MIPTPPPRKGTSPARLVAFVALIITIVVCAGFAVAAIR